MSLSIRSSSEAATFGSPGTGITVDKPAGVANDDVLIAFVSKTLYADTTTFSCSGWTGQHNNGQTTQNDLHLSILSKVITNAAGEPSTYTFTAAGSDASMTAIIVCVRGANTSTPLDPTNSTNPASGFINNTLNSVTVDRTSTVDFSMALQCCVISLGSVTERTWGAPSPHYVHIADVCESSTGSTNNQMGVDYWILGASGSATGTEAWTHSPSDSTVETQRAIVMLQAASVATVEPTDYSGLKGWWDASQEPLANNDLVSVVADRAGSGRSLTATGDARPTFKTGIFPTGLPGILFDGTDDYLNQANAISTFLAASAGTVFIVAQVSAVDTTNADSSAFINDFLWTDSNRRTGVFLRNNSSVYTAQFWNNDGSADTTTQTITLDTPVVLWWRHSGGTLYGSLDGGTESSVASGDTNSVAGNLSLGGRSGGTTWFSGYIAEAFFYNESRSSTELTALADYLLAKWVETAATTDADAEAATGAGAGNAATAKVSPAVSAAASAGAANDAAPTTSVVGSATEANAAGVANDATTTAAPNIATSTSAGAANDPQTAVAASADDSTAIGVANDATVTTGVVASATEAAAAGAANTATSTVAPSADTSTAAGAGNDPQIAVAATVTEAASTGAAVDATVSTSGSASPDATEATAVGAAYDAQASIQPSADSSASTGTGSDASTSVAATANTATSAGAAYDATISVSGELNVDAVEATSAGAAYDAAIAVTSSADYAASSGTVTAANLAVAAKAAVALSTGTGLQASALNTSPDPNPRTITVYDHGHTVSVKRSIRG